MTFSTEPSQPLIIPFNTTPVLPLENFILSLDLKNLGGQEPLLKHTIDPSPNGNSSKGMCLNGISFDCHHAPQTLSSSNWYLSRYESPRMLFLGRGMIINWLTSGHPTHKDFFQNFETQFLTRGAEFVRELDGQFSFVVFDKASQRLYAFRDPVGYYPLYYAQTKRGLTVSSHFLPLLQESQRPPQLCLEALTMFFLFGYVLAPLTLVEGIENLLPGEFLMCGRQDKYVKHRYWTIPPFSPEVRSPGEHVEWTRHQMPEILRDYINPTQPNGLFLSGGLDSSILAALMRRHITKDICTYGFGFNVPHPKAQYGLDLPYAQLVAEHCGTKHREIVFDTSFPMTRALLTNIPKLDALLVSPNVITKHAVAHMAEQAGIANFMVGSAASIAFGAYTRKTWYKKVKNTGSNEEELFEKVSHFLTLEEIHQLFPETRDINKQHIMNRISPYLAGLNSPESLDVKEAAWDLILASGKAFPLHLNAAIGLQGDFTIPFADTRLWKNNTTIPRPLRSGGGSYSHKFCLTQAFGHLIPESVITRPKVGYPSYYWYRGELEKIQKTLFSKTILQECPFLNSRVLKGMLHTEQHAAKKSTGKKSWGLTVFLLWFLSHLGNQQLLPADEKALG